MTQSVVVRLVGSAGDELRGVVEDVRTGDRFRFTSAEELVDHLMRLACAGGAGQGPGTAVTVGFPPFTRAWKAQGPDNVDHDDSRTRPLG